MLSMCSHPEFDDEMLPLSKEMRLKAQRFVRELSVEEQQFHRTHEHTKRCCGVYSPTEHAVYPFTLLLLKVSRLSSSMP